MATQNHHKQTSYQPGPGFQATSSRHGEPAAEAAQTNTTVLTENRTREASGFQTPRRQVRTFSTCAEQKRAVSGGTAVPVRSRPFDDDKDLDPFMLFERLQWPFSPLKDDSARYRQEAEAALVAQEESYRIRGESLTVDEIKDMVHLTHNLGKYAHANWAYATNAGVDQM
ncbi:hypothetical protein LTR37_004311 [Vermiconidia calcicola]|uniref:Uncharacterized protein n=1 Tax=Vermiconidia calcicola TaxID=1690605 RepID=A0ACC3NMR1_9PEZI|nr:hypothetical protein LTR37_004311 [Vermiconidia calcicola]